MPFEEPVRHVALMRPRNLVVKYEALPLIPAVEIPENFTSAGVFRVDPDDYEVNEAFRRSEPASHDDWNPNSLERVYKTLVKQTLTKIKRYCKEILIITSIKT